MTCANHPERSAVAFCQNCGKPVCPECARTIGAAVFCEPCLAARLAAADAFAAGIPMQGEVRVDGSSATASTAASTASSSPPPPPFNDIPYGARPASGAVPPFFPVDAPNPVLAGFLGFIPGVGAMYNGQYAKGIVHLIVFAILVSLADNHGIFGLFVTGWIFYQVFEAFQTAKARRDGLPLPNPFNLNDVGDRFGFGKSWASSTSAQTTSGQTAARADAAATSTTGAPAPPNYDAARPNPVPPNPAPPNSVPPNSVPSSGPTPNWGNPPSFDIPASVNEFFGNARFQSNYARGTYAEAGQSTGVPYASVPFVTQPGPVIPVRTFPAGAVVLIVLGVLFLLINSGFFQFISFTLLVPIGLIGLGLWLFLRRMTDPLDALSSKPVDVRIVCALRSSAWIVLTGILFLFDRLGVLSWARSWPLFIVLAGLLALLKRSVNGRYAQSSAPASYPYTPEPTTPNVPFTRQEGAYTTPQQQEQGPPSPSAAQGPVHVQEGS